MERPLVRRRVRDMRMVREGRGYSLPELREVELDGSKALRRGIPFDKFRKTKHEDNIKKLNSILTHN